LSSEKGDNPKRSAKRHSLKITQMFSEMFFLIFPLRFNACMKSGSLHSRIARTRQDPESFYGEHSAAHPAVQAFQFFQNDKVKTWFKRPEQAEAIAKTLGWRSVSSPCLFPSFFLTLNFRCVDPIAAIGCRRDFFVAHV